MSKDVVASGTKFSFALIKFDGSPSAIRSLLYLHPTSNTFTPPCVDNLYGGGGRS